MRKDEKMLYDDLSEILDEYKSLFNSKHYVEAALLSNTFLEELYAEGKREQVKEILENTINTVSRCDIILSAWLYLGDLLYQEDLYDKARVCYLKGIGLETSEPIKKSELLFGIGNTYYMEGIYPIARSYYQSSLEISREQNFKTGIAENLTQLSDVAQTLGEYNEAEILGRESLELNVELQRNNAVLRSTQSLCNLVRKLKIMGKDEKVRDLLRFCLDTLRSEGNEAALELVQFTLSNMSAQGS